MSLTWIRESAPAWDADKARVVGGAPPGSLSLALPEAGAMLPGEWWRVEDGARVVGYGWMDVVWGEGEVLLAVAQEAWGHGVGTFILDHLDAEAARRGLRYIYNAVLPTHPDHERVTRWLMPRGFALGAEDDRLQRRVPNP